MITEYPPRRGAKTRDDKSQELETLGQKKGVCAEIKRRKKKNEKMDYE